MEENEINNRPAASERLLLTSQFHAHPWNVVHPRPPEPPPVSLKRYRLTVRHNSEMRAGGDERVTAEAECHSVDQLLELNAQFIAIDYCFVKLELIESP